MLLLHMLPGSPLSSLRCPPLPFAYVLQLRILAALLVLVMYVCNRYQWLAINTWATWYGYRRDCTFCLRLLGDIWKA